MRTSLGTLWTDTISAISGIFFWLSAGGTRGTQLLQGVWGGGVSGCLHPFVGVSAGWLSSGAGRELGRWVLRSNRGVFSFFALARSQGPPPIRPSVASYFGRLFGNWPVLWNERVQFKVKLLFLVRLRMRADVSLFTWLAFYTRSESQMYSFFYFICAPRIQLLFALTKLSFPAILEYADMRQHVCVSRKLEVNSRFFFMN